MTQCFSLQLQADPGSPSQEESNKGPEGALPKTLPLTAVVIVAVQKLSGPGPAATAAKSDTVLLTAAAGMQSGGRPLRPLPGMPALFPTDLIKGEARSVLTWYNFARF